MERFFPKITMPENTFGIYQHLKFGDGMSDSIIKVFNTTGPCVPSKHYMLPVLPRMPDINEMINGEYYFIIHAPRQSGKTTYLQFLTKQINSEGNRYAFWCSLATLRNLTDRNEAMTSMAAQINEALKTSEVKVLQDLAFPDDALPQSDASVKIKIFLKYLSTNLDKDLVVFFDEADCLAELPLITFLSQIRDGYISRDFSPTSKFPRSMALVGMRDIRDYLIQVRPDAASTGLASPFNIKRKAITLANFTKNEIKTLYHQHTEASGQIFEADAIERAYYWSEGQPWLVNALALEAVFEILNNDYKIPITGNLIDESANILIKRRDTHIESLLERLKEPRVIKVMDSVFAGTPGKVLKNPDDRKYCIDLGLVVEDHSEKLRPSNQIYSEVLSRMLTDEIQYVLDDTIAQIKWHDGKVIFMTYILKQFQSFWRENAFSFPLRIYQSDIKAHNAVKEGLDSLPLASELSESDTLSIIGRVKDAIARQYDEASYSLLLMSYLQKVLNSGALVFRQFSQGRGSVDLCVIYKDHKYLVEVKLFGQKPFDESLRQLSGYLDISGEKEGWLVIFDRDRKKSWETKLTWETVEYAGKTIHIVGC
jgi:hypothetical protein